MIKKFIFKNKLLSLSLLPLTLLGTMANNPLSTNNGGSGNRPDSGHVGSGNTSEPLVLPVIPKDSAKGVYGSNSPGNDENRSNNQSLLSLKIQPYFTHNSYNLGQGVRQKPTGVNLSPNGYTPVYDETSIIDYGDQSEYQKQLNELVSAYQQSLNDSSAKFTFPTSKYYDFKPHVYTVWDFGYSCYYKSKGYRDVCDSTQRNYEDQLITNKPRIMVNSLKGFEKNKTHMVKFRPNNLEYNDWTTRSILRPERHKVNWKEQYGYFRKNVFGDTFLYFNNKDKKPFSSERYSLHVNRSHYHGSYIPMFTGFHKYRTGMRNVLGFESYDEINIPFDQMLKRNKTDKVSADFLQKNPGINLQEHTSWEYGWYNFHWWTYYKDFKHSHDVVERMRIPTLYNWGSPYMSWWSDYWSSVVSLYTPIPLLNTTEPHELKPMTFNEYKTNVSGWGDDLFHVNYDQVVKFDQPYFSAQQGVYPFSLNLKKIKEHNDNLKDFFKISSNFNFYINYTFNGEKKKTNAYKIQDLIGNNALIFNYDALGQETNISNIYLSIEPIEKDRVQLIHENYPQWQFGISAKSSEHYNVDGKDSLTSIKFYKLSKVSVNESIVRHLFPSQLLFYEHLSQLFNTDDKNKYPVSPQQVHYVLKPEIKPDDLKGTATLTYYDPLEAKKITKEFTGMIKLGSGYHNISNFEHTHSSSITSIRHSSVQALNQNYMDNSDYLFTNRYWNKHAKIIPLSSNDLDPFRQYKIQVSGFDRFPDVKNQWESQYHNKIFTIRSNFSVAPIQRERYTLKQANHYSSNLENIWNELFDFSPFASVAKLNKSDFNITTSTSNNKDLSVTVSVNKSPYSGSRTYYFTYDPSKIKEGRIVDPDRYSSYSYQRNSRYSNPTGTAKSQYSKNSNAPVLSDNAKLLLFGSLGAGVLVMLAYFAIKAMRRSQASEYSSQLVIA